jgi:thioredoxin reductase (NADPH)
MNFYLRFMLIFDLIYGFGSHANVRDVIIIGSGPAGCTAAMYTARAMLNPLVIGGYNYGGQLMLTSDIENFPGNPKITGPELMNKLREQAQHFGAEFWDVDCNEIKTSCLPYEVVVNNCTIQTKSIIISTGADAIWLGAEDEDKYKGQGISTCATCDGYLFRNKPILVVGGGDSAMEEATFLSKFATSVTIVNRSPSFRASKVRLRAIRYDTYLLRWTRIYLSSLYMYISLDHVE